MNKIFTKIDFHNHTTNSDGDYDPFDLCEMKTGIVDTLCITDHYPFSRNSYTHNKEFESRYYDLKKPDMPDLIIGMEYYFKNSVECLLFGDSFIRDVIKHDPKDYREMNSILKDHEAVIFICHPVRGDELYNDLLLSMSDGIEISIGGTYLSEYENRFKEISKQYDLYLLSNSDFHVSSNITDTYNIINASIKTEYDLISVIKNKNTVIENVFGETKRNT